MPPLKRNQKVMLTLTGISVAVFIFMDPYYFIWRTPQATADAAPASKARKRPASRASKPTSADPTAGNIAVGVVAAKEGFALEGWGRDPFLATRRRFDDKATMARFKLGGISVRGRDRYALINSKIVRVGDKVSGLKVTEIERDKVILTREGRRYTLTWGD